jgi:type VI secretion system secreted protein Hcp
LIVACTLLPGAAVQAAYDTFMVFTGGGAPPAQGESKDEEFPKAIEVYSFSWGASNPSTIGSGGTTAGKVSLSSFNIMKKFDSASPALFTACATGKHYDQVRVSIRRNSGDNGVVFLTYTFTNVLVESIQWSGSSGGDDSPTESVSLAFGGVKIDYKVEGGQETETVTASYPIAP